MPPSRAVGGKISSPPKTTCGKPFQFPKHKEISQESHKQSDSALKKRIGQQLDIETLYSKPRQFQPSKKTMLNLAKPK